LECGALINPEVRLQKEVETVVPANGSIAGVGSL
jgi:hypothetical protein